MIKSTGAVVVPSPDAVTNNVMAADIRDIRPLVDVPLGWEWLTWTLVGLIGALILRKLWVLWKNRPPAGIKRPRVSAEQKAHQQLDAALRLLMEPKVFCATVSDAVRLYLEERFRFRAPERTTEEFLSELQKSPRLNPEQKGALAMFLERCDLVKFARFEPAETELKELHSVAHRLVEEMPKAMVEAVATATDPEVAAAQRAAKVALAEHLDKRFVKCVVLALVVAGCGVAMFGWSAIALAQEPLVSEKGLGWHTFKYMFEAVWSKPVGVALMGLGVTYLVEAVMCKARRPVV